ncbi:MAG TPA: divalent-cation tolerance protein CutA [Methanoregulaceae archaeon]|mgnify:FL=1|nr:divalent-cation tolerance protein CutA [Methanoregulaceae archaeon]
MIVVMPLDAAVVLVTAPPGEASTLARLLVDERLAACVQLVKIRSIYRWEGQVEDQPEELLLIKTRRSLADRVCARVREVHPYEVPEALVLPVASGLDPYLDWLLAETHQAP